MWESPVTHGGQQLHRWGEVKVPSCGNQWQTGQTKELGPVAAWSPRLPLDIVEADNLADQAFIAGRNGWSATLCGYIHSAVGYVGRAHVDRCIV